jgi:hypothetical protein
MLGIQPPEHFNKDGLESLIIKEGGVIHLIFKPEEGKEPGHIFLIPEAYADTFDNKWHCITPSIPLISEWMPQCSYRPLKRE